MIRRVPEPVRAKFYGCGAPLPLGIEGLRVLDLGSGSGRDCYVCAALVGERGSVTGIDMTEEQLATAREHVDEWTRALGYREPNMRFIRGEIEYLDRAGIADASVDLVISNCVINLSPDKPRVLREAYRVLADGGELYFSDVYCDRRLPDAVRKDKVLWGDCIAGAMYAEDFRCVSGSLCIGQRVRVRRMPWDPGAAASVPLARPPRPQEGSSARRVHGPSRTELGPHRRVGSGDQGRGG